MSEKTNIQWTDATHNIARGCTKVVDEKPDGKKVSDCKYCYMYRDSMDGTRYDPKTVVKTKTVFDLPLKYKEKESHVREGSNPLMFTSSLTDVYHQAIDPFRNEYWNIARKTPGIIKQILTKRPERIDKQTPEDFLHGEYTKSIWLGTSVGTQYGQRRIHELCKSEFSGIKFISAEPLWGELKIFGFNSATWGILNHGIGWVIVGGESGHGKIPNDPSVKYGYRECKLEWIESIIEQCKKEGVPVFVKQMGTHLSRQLKMSDRHGGDINEFPKHLQIREFPKF